MKLLQLLCFTVLLSLVSCKTRTASVIETIQIPDLLMRPHVIGPEEEMGFVLETYNELTNQIKARRMETILSAISTALSYMPSST